MTDDLEIPEFMKRAKGAEAFAVDTPLSNIPSTPQAPEKAPKVVKLKTKAAIAEMKKAKPKAGPRLIAAAKEAAAALAQTNPPARKAAAKAVAKKLPVTKAKTHAKAKTGTKQDQLVSMLKRAKGASIAEIADELGWLPHTTRAAITVAVKRKLGFDVTSEKHDTRGRVYKIA